MFCRLKLTRLRSGWLETGASADGSVDWMHGGAENTGFPLCAGKQVCWIWVKACWGCSGGGLRAYHYLIGWGTSGGGGVREVQIEVVARFIPSLPICGRSLLFLLPKGL